MELVTCMAWFLLAWTIARAIYLISKPNTRRLPPGPTPLPIIGNILNLGKKPHKSLAELAKTHGAVMSLKLGRITTIVISSATVAKEVLQTQDLNFSNRHVPGSLHIDGGNSLSIAWLPIGPKWRSIRKICTINLFSHRKLELNEHLRSCKFQELVADVEASCESGSAIKIGDSGFKTMLNMLSNTFFSVDLSAERESGKSCEFKEAIGRITEEAGKPNLSDFFPIFKRLDPQGINRRLEELYRKMIEFFEGMIDKRLEERKKDGFVMSNDVLDTLLNICEDENEGIDRHDIKHILLDLFVAGTDTTSSTLEWAMAEVLRHPKVLSKAKEELNQIIGKGNVLQESDIARLPYLQNIVKESFRLHPPVPLLLPRTVKEDTELSGYTIPKGAQVLVNAWAIGRDPSTWSDPDSFDPERFLGSEMDVKQLDFGLIPFGGGRRMCPGLPLANRMVHLMLGSLIHRFDWKLGDGGLLEDIDMDDKFGLTLQKAQPLSIVPIHV